MMSFIFNLHTVPIGCCRCLSSWSRHDLVGCERKVVERSQKATSIPEMKKMAKPSMKLERSPHPKVVLDDSHKLSNVAVEMGLKPKRFY
jgi:hypothetical protein